MHPPPVETLQRWLGEGSPMVRVHAVWHLREHGRDAAAAIPALIAALEDDTAWETSSSPNFDGERSDHVYFVSGEAVTTLAYVAPEAAPPDRVAAAIARLWGRMRLRQHYNYCAPDELPLTWGAAALAPFGEPLRAALRDLAAGSEGARAALAALREPA